ncbi:MAG: energy transducer TonB [Chitinophagaceae bacterium]|nr:energy transducer TonB [Chitinophagaceae bacterium]MBK9569644.1 energy transducer TonB [Chitinophagaceae bacterium]MBL0132059.1 energy transducer TonB [Chitinophagaceae bacterium]MBL0271918.1 energy transducer TonB [Chitinophagaceae bacterium]
MEANKILSADILDLIFEDRNKDYGAYELRKTYNRRITRALIITASVALLALIGSVLASSFAGEKTKKFKQQEINLADIKQEEKKVIPPPPPPPKVEPPKVEMKQFTPPVIKKDEEVEKPPPPQEELKDAKIDVVNQEGIKDDNIATPVQIDEGKQIVEEKKEDDENKIFDKVEIEASFPGGDSKWRQYLERNANGQVATDNGAPEGTYTTVVQFVVDKEGNISDVRSLTNHGYGMEEEAMRVIKKGPKWNAAVQNGRQVKAYRKQPITFQVQGE